MVLCAATDTVVSFSRPDAEYPAFEAKLLNSLPATETVKIQAAV
jgi:hypothetical protein